MPQASVQVAGFGIFDRRNVWYPPLLCTEPTQVLRTGVVYWRHAQALRKVSTDIDTSREKQDPKGRTHWEKHLRMS